MQKYNNETVKIGGFTYNGVNNVDTRNYLDSDNKAKAVSYIDTNKAQYTAYVEDGNVVVSKKEYHRPVSKNLGGKEYKNIVSSSFYPDGTKVYETFNHKTLSMNTIRITPEGQVIDVAAEARKARIAKLVKPFAKVAELLTKRKV